MDIPNQPVLFISYGEIGLKKGNRRFFQKALRDNLRRSLAQAGAARVRLEGSRFIAEVDYDIDRATEIASRVSGVVAVRVAQPTPATIEAIEAAALEICRRHPAADREQTFALAVRRHDKLFPLRSDEIARRVGAAVGAERNRWSVDLSRPDVAVDIEIYPGLALLSAARTAGPGGLPVGTAGKLALLLSGGLDSPVAGSLMQKRGVVVEPIYFHSFPYTGDQALKKVKDLARVLLPYQYSLRLHVIHFTQIQEAIRDHCDARYGVVIQRRFMMRIADRVARRRRLQGIVTGDSLGQVASQTLPNMAAVDAAATLPVYRPLVALDKSEIMAMARRLGTYDISNRPYDDCCTLFVPAHPVTKARMETVLAEEEPLDVDALVAEALAQSQSIKSNEL